MIASILSTWHVLIHLILTDNFYEEETTVMPNLNIRQLRYNEVKYLFKAVKVGGGGARTQTQEDRLQGLCSFPQCTRPCSSHGKRKEGTALSDGIGRT